MAIFADTIEVDPESANHQRPNADINSSWTFDILSSSIVINESVSTCKQYDKIVQKLFGDSLRLLSVTANANSFFNSVGAAFDKKPDEARKSLVRHVTVDDVLRFRETCNAFSDIFVDEKIGNLLRQAIIPHEEGVERDAAANLLLKGYKDLMLQETTHTDLMIIDKFLDLVQSVCVTYTFLFIASIQKNITHFRIL